MSHRLHPARQFHVLLLAGAAAMAPGCRPSSHRMTDAELHDFATRYAAAWSSQDPVRFASFYAPDGGISANSDTPAIGRDAVTAVARSYMTAFPDMQVQLDSLGQDGDTAIFYWLWTGTNTGPGGTGAAVRLHGYERWTFSPDHLIHRSEGHYDEADYQRQLQVAPAAGGD